MNHPRGFNVIPYKRMRQESGMAVCVLVCVCERETDRQTDREGETES